MGKAAAGTGVEETDESLHALLQNQCLVTKLSLFHHNLLLPFARGEHSHRALCF